MRKLSNIDTTSVLIAIERKRTLMTEDEQALTDEPAVGTDPLRVYFNTLARHSANTNNPMTGCLLRIAQAYIESSSNTLHDWVAYRVTVAAYVHEINLSNPPVDHLACYHQAMDYQRYIDEAKRDPRHFLRRKRWYSLIEQVTPSSK